MVLDLVGNRSLRDLRRLVAPGGVLVLSGGGTSTGKRQVLGPVWLMLRAKLAAPFLKLARLRAAVAADAAQLADLAALVAGRDRRSRSWTGPSRWPRRQRR